MAVLKRGKIKALVGLLEDGLEATSLEDKDLLLLQVRRALVKKEQYVQKRESARRNAHQYMNMN